MSIFTSKENDICVEQNRLIFGDFSIGLKGVPNARELGGYCIENKTIKHKKLLRSGNLSKPTDTDIQKLSEELKLSLIIDLRSEYEMQTEPDTAIAGAEYLSLPAIDEASSQQNGLTIPKEAYRNWNRFLLDFVKSDLAPKFARDMYPSFIRNEYTQRQLSIFMRRIIDNTDGAVLWHCAQGKDRTGICSALILSALGAEKDLILSDFALSNEYYADEIEQFDKILEQQGVGKDKRLIMKSFVGVNIDSFEAMLDFIDNEYGSMNDYLTRKLKMSDNDFDTLKSKYLE